MESIVGIGLLGCGTVGASVAARLLNDRERIERQSGVRYEVRGVAIKDCAKSRNGLDASLFTHDARALVDDPRVDCIVELIGGTHDAAELVERALERGRSVVSANKDLIATQGPRLHALAASRGGSIRYEAAVCGAIPIVRTIDAALAGDRIEALGGVVNGTCTAILSAMEAGAEYADALAEAQRLGYAEADPSNDIDGVDAAHKLAVLMQLAFGLAVISPRIRHSGIAQVSKRDIARAQMLGYRIRLVAAAARSERGAFADVAPVLVPAAHPFAHASGPENAVRIVARDAGPLDLSGRGAGGPATASAVLGDIVATLRAIGDHHAHAARRFEPALDVAPFFDELPRHPELPRYPRWDNSLLDAPVSRQNSAFS